MLETYLNTVKDRYLRSSVLRLRCSAHNLNIESMRKDCSLEERVCIFCKQRGDVFVEDEFHFVVRCPLYNDERKSYLNHCILNQSFDHFLEVLKLEENMMKTVLFIHKSFRKRTEFLLTGKLLAYTAFICI